MPRTPFRTVPLKSRGSSQPKRKSKRRGWKLSPLFFMLPLAAFTAAFLWEGSPPSLAFDFARPGSAAGDSETARFSQCAGGTRLNCVVDGDTFWYRGQKIRIADINTPETSEPKCRREAELGEQATARLTQLLNAGPFTLEATDRDRDRYGRALRVVTRDGESLGSALEREGLAEHWKGYRGDWC